MRHKVFTIVLLLLQFFCISTDSRISKVSKYMKHWPQISEKTLEQPVVMELNYRSMIYLKDAYYLSNNFTSVWGFKCLSLSQGMRWTTQINGTKDWLLLYKQMDACNEKVDVFKKTLTSPILNKNIFLGTPCILSVILHWFVDCVLRTFFLEWKKLYWNINIKCQSYWTRIKFQV